MFNSLFKIVYFIEFLIIVVVRKYYTAQNRKIELKVDKKFGIDNLFLGLNGVGMIIPLFYVFSTWLDFANYPLPDILGYIGALFFAAGIWLLYRSHDDLGKNWSPVIGIRTKQKLVTNGVYKHIRHPMYAAHMLWAIAQILMLHNWIAGYSFIIFLIPHYLIRVGKEEKTLVSEFGSVYQDYIKRTGRIIPKFNRLKK